MFVDVRAGDAVELSQTRQLWVELWLLELCGVLGLDVAVDLIDIAHVALGAILALDIANALVDS